MKKITLFVDESGIANPLVLQSPLYILSGCIVHGLKRNDIAIKADQIKYKYWNTTDIVFHSREIGRKEGDFKIFKDPSLYMKFQKDLFHFLHTAPFSMLFVIVDKTKAKTKNWNSQKVYDETAYIMVENFILSLIAQSKCRGRLVIESATSQKDFSFHKAASHFLSRGIPKYKILHTEVKNVLTEISFVTKNNFDIEEQIADLCAYGANLAYLGKKKATLTSYEQGIKKVMEKKLFTIHPNLGKKKKRYYSNMNTYHVIP